MSAKHNNAGDVAAPSEVKRLLGEDLTPWYKKPNLLRLYLLLIPAALGVEMITGYDGSVLNGLQAVNLWNEYYGNPHGAILGVMTSSLAIGTAFGILYMPFFNDRFVRRFCVILGSVIVAIRVVLQTYAANVGMFIASRIIISLGSPFSLAGAAQLIVELAYPKERSTIDHHDEALQILIEYHAEGNESSTFIAADTKANWHRVFVAIYGLISYYLAKILALFGIMARSTQDQLNVLRRKQLMTAYISTTFLFACYTACSSIYAEDGSNRPAAITVITLIFLFNACYNLMQPFQYLYISKIFSFILRWKFFFAYVVYLEEMALIIEGDKAAVEVISFKAAAVKEKERV
ncbi:hypothetical protein EDB81DRAFT_873763 [Dactylonectria macrodidyma]|uniref:Major facilitator superfamily (MFS) profile domain-containing protein n=1 Tax=Dactylonectria macrodidyma TaxID=307937 RepID=A0A9P9D2H3_9HYPO|nr:hypothetical protein EDB81DRAFT_873763 [Dactylonectria macrodidyma]